jgi:hypothetical protein
MATAIEYDQDTNSLWRKDRDHFLHPWTHFDSFKHDGSLILTREQCDVLVDTLRDAIVEVTQELRREGFVRR